MSQLEAMKKAAAKGKAKPAPPPAPTAEPPAPGPVPPPQQPKKPRLTRLQKLEKKMEDKRLPDGSNFHMDYDGRAKLWTGTLMVPKREFGDDETVGPDDYLTFEATNGGVIKLPVMLDKLYREHLAKPFAAVTPGEGPK